MFPHNFINNQPPPLNAQNMNEIEQEIDKKANSSNVYTKTEADNKFALKTAISDMATKTWVNAQGFIKSLAGYATEAWVEAKGYITSSALNPYRTSSDQDVIDGGKVDKVTGKGLSTNDYTNTDKAKSDCFEIINGKLNIIYEEV